MKLLKPLAEHKGLELSVSIDNQAPQYLKGLGPYLHRCLLNLLSNAVKFTQSGSVQVLVTCAATSATQQAWTVGSPITLSIQVKDTGIGIPPDKFEEIFEHFSRLTPSYQGIYKGSGLGLYTVRQYVNAMQGKITVESELGQGSCFTLTLPLLIDDHDDHLDEETSIYKELTTTLAPESPATQQPQTDTTANDDNSEQTHVLVVEDNSMAASVAISALKRLHCQVDWAKTGQEGVNKATQNHYDLIFMDIGLPDFDGLEVTRRIRQSNTKQGSTPIVGLTGHVGKEKHHECVEIGMNDVLTKPAPPLLLESTLKKFVWEKAEDTNEKATTDQPATLSAIDWDGTLQFMNLSPLEVEEMLDVCAEELEKSNNIFKSTYQAKDIDALSEACKLPAALRNTMTFLC